MQNFQGSSFALQEQIESAYKKGGGAISLAGKMHRASGGEERTINFTNRGHVSPFSNKADRFHVGRFTPGLKLPPGLNIATSIMRECCKNVLFTPFHLSNGDVRAALVALKRTKTSKAAIRGFIVPLLPSPRHRLAIQDLDSDLFEVVDVLTAMGRAETGSYVALGLFAGLLMTSTTFVEPRPLLELGLARRCKTEGDL